jgi:hypothetical protein
MTQKGTNFNQRQNFAAFNRTEFRLDDFNHFSGKFTSPQPHRSREPPCNRGVPEQIRGVALLVRTGFPKTG